MWQVNSKDTKTLIDDVLIVDFKQVFLQVTVAQDKISSFWYLRKNFRKTKMCVSGGEGMLVFGKVWVHAKWMSPTRKHCKKWNNALK